MEDYYHVVVLVKDKHKRDRVHIRSPIIFPDEIAVERAESMQDFTGVKHGTLSALDDYPEELRWIPDMKTWPANQTEDLIDRATLMYNL